MKFGKRLAAEAARRWRPYYLDYKACKRAIQQDVLANDARGRNFDIVLRRELHKISSFYVDKETELEATMAAVQRNPRCSLHSFRSEVTDLRKFAVLNYIAVIKAVKKRNRHLSAKVGAGVKPMRAVELLNQQYFYTSPKLAALATQGEILMQGLEPRPPADELQAEYGCPICLNLLHNPVVLTCAHRFCWGCLISHCATTLRNRGSGHGGHVQPGDANKAGGKLQLLPAAAAEPFEDSNTPTVATYDCPVCRKAHVLDLDRLQVDPHLDRFTADLHQRVSSQTEEQQLKQPAPAATTLSFTAKVSSQEAAMPDATQEESQTAPTSSAKAAGVTVAWAEESGTSVRVHSVAISPSITCPAPVPQKHQDTIMEPSKPSDLADGLLASILADEEDNRKRQEALDAEAAAAVAPPETSGEPPLLPPQKPEHAGRLTVVLDLDGTLLSSYTPRRAPVLPPGSIAYIVGRGGRLNPNGVFVVERPGLKAFLSKLSQFAEVVLFTAGLEDYAKPILDELDRRYDGIFKYRLYRPATVACSAYPCLKDLSLLGRDMRRTVLVDDTPLAFLRQPDNGIPIFNFRGDVDDRVLTEAILPLLQALSTSADVRPVLHRRFDMPRWFMSQGVSFITPQAKAAAASKQRRLTIATRPPTAPAAAPEQVALRHRASSSTLLLCDFDKTITDYDAGERLVEELAPELVPMLTSIEMPANFVPMTNAVLSEMARRGIARDQILATLRRMGGELPEASLQLLQWAARAGIDIRILSDCNSLFIGHILTGAKVNGLVKEVITNSTSFERIADDSPSPDLPREQQGSSSSSALVRPFLGKAAAAADGKFAQAGRAASHRLQVHPRFPYESGEDHGCKLCPANLCKGQELENLRRQHPYQRIVYCGDGANDLCPALSLTPSDVVLARRGHALEQLISERADRDDDSRVVARVMIWNDHEHLLDLVQKVME